MVPLIFLFLFSLFLFLPVFFGRVDLVNRGNDLSEFFWPLVHYSKTHILTDHQIPLWNNMFFSGMPLVADPQSPLFYPPNWIFLVVPIGVGFIILFVLHIFLAGTGFYLLSKRLGIGSKFSLFASCLYITNARLAASLEAGHVGLVYSFAWLPFLYLATLNLAKKPRFWWVVVFAVSAAGLFFTHTITFLLGVSSAILVFALTTLFQGEKLSAKSILFLTVGLALTFGLTAITLLPQLNWLPQTTRSLLLSDRDVYPKWLSKKEVIQAVFVPWTTSGYGRGLETEKWLSAGIFTAVLAFVGFLTLKRKWKLAAILLAVIVGAIISSNVSPLYPILLKIDWYVMLRVATRLWTFFLIPLILLAALGAQKVTARYPKGALVFATLALAESTALFWFWLFKPIPPQLNFVPEEVYQYLSSDPNLFRVFCVTRCLSQRKVAEYGLETAEGYDTVQQKNYYDAFIQLDQVYWNHYTLALPPFEIYRTKEIQVYASSLAEYNIKYIVSPYPQNDTQLEYVGDFGNFKLYRNIVNDSRAYYPSDSSMYPKTTYISSNKIEVDVASHKDSTLTVAQVYNKDWVAYLDNTKRTEIKESNSHLQNIELEAETKIVGLSFEPKQFMLGKVLTLATLAVLLFVFLFRLGKRSLLL